MRRSGAHKGQSIIEFALVLPLFLLLLFGLIDFSRLLFSFISLTDATRELNRSAAVPFNTDGTSTPMNAFNNFLLLGGTFSPATSLTLNNSSGGGSGTVVCSSMTTATGCTLKLTGTDNGTPSSPPTQLTLNMSGVSGNASGSATFILSYSTWNPKSFLTASHTGDFLMITVLSTPDNNGNYSGNVVVCPLPVQATCHLPTNAVTNAPDGTVQSDLYYTFHFSPLFQNKVEGIVDASLVLPMTNLTTSARSYIE